MTDETESNDEPAPTLLQLSSWIVASYLSENEVAADAIPGLIRTVHGAMANLGAAPAAGSAEKQKPAVPISRSVHQDHLICLEDGKKLKMLKRYLRSRYDMSPEDYRRKWGLQPDYPMVAPVYAAKRSEFAKQIGLGKGVRRRKA